MKQISNDRIAKAATTYLERKGYEIRETDIDREFPLIIAQDSDTLVFISAAGAYGDWPERRFGRDDFEQAAIDYLTKHGDVDMDLRADEIDIQAVSGDRAILRHHINCEGVSRAG